MVRRYYDKPQDADERNPFRCQGFLHDGVIRRKIGIGVLIRDSGMESYREVLEVGIEAADGSAENAATGPSDLIFRTYRIVIDRKPVILITESFPHDLYK